MGDSTAYAKPRIYAHEENCRLVGDRIHVFMFTMTMYIIIVFNCITIFAGHHKTNAIYIHVHIYRKKHICILSKYKSFPSFDL